MKDVMITYLKEINKDATPETLVTRLKYSNNGREEYVEDFSYFANEEHMSKDLLEALRCGQTLTSKQRGELQKFIIEQTIRFE